MDNNLEEIKKQLSDLVEEIAIIKSRGFLTSLRFDAFLRYQMAYNKFDFNDYFRVIESYSKQLTFLRDIKDEPNLALRLIKAKEFNRTAICAVMADDLKILPLIEATGGASPEFMASLLELPHTNSFELNLRALPPANA